MVHSPDQRGEQLTYEVEQRGTVPTRPHKPSSVRSIRTAATISKIAMTLDVLIAIPTHDGCIHRAAVGGIYSSVAKLGSEKVGLVVRQMSFLPRLRDLLTIDFLQSQAKYMLCLDADIGWTVKHLEKLLAFSKELVADREF